MELNASIKKNSIRFIAILGVIGLAFILRISYPFSSFSFDEIFTITFAQQSVADMWHLSQWETNPPLLYFFMKAWTMLFGVGEQAVRMLSVLAGTAAVAGTYALGQLLFSRRAGFLAAAITAVSPLWIFFSREARMYSLLTAAFLWASYFCLSYLRHHARWRGVFASLLLCVVALLHFGAWIPLGISIVFFIWLAKLVDTKRMWHMLGIVAPACIAVLAVIVRLLFFRGTGTDSFLNHWAFSFTEFSHFIPQIFTAGLLTTAFLHWAVVVLCTGILLIALLRFSLLWQKKGTFVTLSIARPEHVERWWIMATLLLPIFFGWLIHLEPIRFFVISLALLPLIFGAAAVSFSQIPRLVFSVSLIAICLMLIIPVWQNAESIRWKELTAYVESQAVPEDLILTHLFHESWVYNWYATKSASVGFFPYNNTFSFEDVVRYNAVSIVNENNVSLLEQYTQGHSKVFLILPMGSENNFWRNDLVLEWFTASGWRQVSTESFGRFSNLGVVYVFTR